VIGFTTGAEARQKRRSAPEPQRPLHTQAGLTQDEYKSCDVAVRDFVQGRKEATALPVKEVRVDGLRMRLNFVHQYGESADTPPNLSFTRGESVDERRKALNETKQRINALADAAKNGNVWFVIALRKDSSEPTDGRRSPSYVPQDENRSSASAVVFENIENKCITVAEFQNIPPDRISEGLRGLLGDASPVDRSAGRLQP